MANGSDDDDEGFPTSAEISRVEAPGTKAEPQSYRPRSLWPVAVTIGVVLVVAIIIIYYLAR